MQSFICNHCGKYNKSKSLICAHCLRINKIETGLEPLSFSLETTFENLSITYGNPKKASKLTTNINNDDFLIDHDVLDTHEILKDVFTPLTDKKPIQQTTLPTIKQNHGKPEFKISSENTGFLQYFIPKFEDSGLSIDLVELGDSIINNQAFNLIFSFPEMTQKESIVSYYGNYKESLDPSKQINNTRNLTFVLLSPLPKETIKSLYMSFLKYKGAFRFMVFNDISNVFEYFCNIIKKVESGFNFGEENLELELLKTIKSERVKMNAFDILNKDKSSMDKEEKEKMKIKNSYFKMLNQVEGINEARAKVIFAQFDSFKALMNLFFENDKESCISKLGNIRIGNTVYSKRLGTAQAQKLYDYFN